MSDRTSKQVSHYVYVCDYCNDPVLWFIVNDSDPDLTERHAVPHITDKGTTVCFGCLSKAGYTLSTMTWKVISAQLPYFANSFGDTTGPQNETPPF